MIQEQLQWTTESFVGSTAEAVGCIIDASQDGKTEILDEPRQHNVAVEFRDTGDVTGKHYYCVRAQQEDEIPAWSSPSVCELQMMLASPPDRG